MLVVGLKMAISMRSGNPVYKCKELEELGSIKQEERIMLKNTWVSTLQTIWNLRNFDEIKILRHILNPRIKRSILKGDW